MMSSWIEAVIEQILASVQNDDWWVEVQPLLHPSHIQSLLNELQNRLLRRMSALQLALLPIICHCC